MGSRAHLLAGLRTGGPRATSPFDGDDSTSSIIDHQQRQHSGSPPSNGLKANAAPFTPGSRTASRGSPPHDSAQELEGQFAALRMQQAMASAVANHAQPHLAAMYGATSGQPLANEAQFGQSYDYQTQFQAQEMEQLIRQKQAQLAQNQLLQQHQQQQQTRQSQIDALRLQAANHQKQQQMLAQQQQQQLLLAQMQAEVEAQQQQEQFQQHVYTAQEQRQAAQASIQAGLRQRQVQQMYVQLLQQQQQQAQQDEAATQQEALLQRLHYLRQLQQGAVISPTQQQQQQQQYVDLGYSNSPPQTGGRVPARAGSPAQAQLERRQRQASNTAADSAVSWRSAKSASSQARSPPSIVVDDGASEKSEPGTASSTTSEQPDTPETSSEDVGTMMRSKSAIPTRTAKKVPVLAPIAAPRAISLSAAPRMRTFSSTVDGAGKTGLNSGAGSPSGSMTGASRQPRGPPTEFHAVNFTSRINARTRRDAMSKLCASPRAASFNMIATRSSILT